MRLSEAMMLGSVTCEMKGGDINVCALGAAANAVGVPKQQEHKYGVRLGAIKQCWPWLGNISNGCKGHDDDYTPYSHLQVQSSWAEQIFYRFDRSVVANKSMTFEQLVDYVRSIEPDCGECSQFQCTCVQKMDETLDVPAYTEA